MSEHRAYTPPGSLVPFFLSEKFISLVVGPYGSSKTTAGIMKIAYHAKRMAPCRDGIRRSRAVWVRTSRQTLLDTSIPDFLKWLPDGVAGTFYKTELKFILRFDDVECEILFRGLDDANDVRRLLSLQASFAIFDEFREIHQDIYENMQPRLGRYPDKDMVKPRPEWGVDHKGDPIGGCVREDGQPNKLLWGMSNPPDLDTFWEGVLTDPPDNVHVTIQPSGLSPEADWIQYLPTDYYEDLMKGKSQDWIDVCVHAKFGKSLSGKPVYASTFNSDFHIAKTPFIPLKDSSKPIVIGLDFGRTPAAVFFQRNVYGQVVCLGEITSENMGIDTFLNTKLKMFLVERFPGCTFVVAPDPAGWHKQQIGEISPVDVIKRAGLRCVKPATNDPERRIQAVERLLTGNVGGKPLLVINPECKVLIQGFRSGYRYKLKRDGFAETTPQKNEFSHCFVADTPISTPNGNTLIADIRVGDYVHTPLGAQQVTATMNRIAEVIELRFSNGSSLVCTPEHPFFVDGKTSPVRADELQYSDVLVTEGEMQWGVQENIRLSSSKGFGFIQNLAGIWSRSLGMLYTESGIFTALPGLRLLAQYPLGCTSTTKTMIRQITHWVTLNLFVKKPTLGTTRASGLQSRIRVCLGGLQLCTKQPNSGMPQMLGAHGIVGMGKPRGMIGRKRCMFARNAEQNTERLLVPVRGGFVQWLANRLLVAPLAWMISKCYAVYARLLSGKINTPRQEPAVRLVGRKPLAGQRRVYDLTVVEAHSFYAKGILVSNCHDAAQYAALVVEGNVIGGQFGSQRREVTHVHAGGWT